MKSQVSGGEDGTVSGSPAGVQILSFLCGLLAAFLGFKSAAQDYGRIDKLIHLDRFVETPGKFLKVEIRQDTSGAKRAYYPDVLYEYFVDGKSVWGWRLSYEEESRPKAYWEGRMAAYAPGKTTRVYYNPADPKDSIVEKKSDGLMRAWLKFGLGAVFIAFGLLLVLLPAGGWIKKAFTGT